MIRERGERVKMRKSRNNDLLLHETIEHWKHLSSLISEPQNEDDYEKLSNLLDKLLDIVGDNESHELIGLVDIISHMISTYDDEHAYPFTNASSIDSLKYLMREHNLKQSDLTEIGSQGVVSEVLNGKRQLNLSQIKKLAKRFHVTIDTFVD